MGLTESFSHQFSCIRHALESWELFFEQAGLKLHIINSKIGYAYCKSKKDRGVAKMVKCLSSKLKPSSTPSTTKNKKLH
jgi:hypothetical protein